MAVTVSPVNTEARKELDIRPGDTVRVWQKVVEKGKTRLQPFEGLVLARKHGTEPGATFTVRRTSSGVGIERIFPLFSPNIDKIEIVRRAKVRRAKLYYIREKVAREVRRQMRRMEFVNMATESESEAAERAKQEAEAAEAAAAEEQAKEETSAEETVEAQNELQEQEEKTEGTEKTEDEAETEEAEETDTTDDKKEEK